MVAVDESFVPLCRDHHLSTLCMWLEDYVVHTLLDLLDNQQIEGIILNSQG